MTIDATADAPPTGGHGLVSIISACVIGAVSNMVINTLPAYLPILTHARGYSDSQIGLCAMVEVGGIAVGNIGAAQFSALIDRITWRVTVAIGMAILLVANLLSTGAENFLPFLGLRLLAGIGGGIALAIVYAILAEGDGARSLGIYTIGQLGSAWLAVPLLSSLAQNYGVTSLFQVLASFGLLGILLAFLLPCMSTREAVAERHGQHASEEVSVAGWLSILSVFLFFFGIGAVYAYLSYMGTGWGLNDALVEGSLTTMMFVSMTAGILVTIMGSRFGFVGPLYLGLIGTLVAIALLGLIHPVSAFIVVGSLFGFALTFTTSFQFEAVVMIDGSSRTAMMVSAATLSGFAIGPAVAGYLTTPDFGIVNGLGFIACALSLVLIAIARRLHRKAAEGSVALTDGAVAQAT